MSWEEEGEECDICPACLDSGIVEISGDLGRDEWDVIGLKACPLCKQKENED